MAQRRYHRYVPEKADRGHKTSSRAAARAWLKGRPDQQAIRIHLEALGLAKRAKRDLAKFATLDAAQRRFMRQLERAKEQNPELAAEFIKDARETVLAGQRFKLRLRSFRTLPDAVAVQVKFTYASAAVLARAKSMKVEAVAALLMCCASQAAGVRSPRPTEAAAMGVAAGLDAKTNTRAEQEKLEANWAKRLRLVQARVERALASGENLLRQYGIPD